MGYYTRYKLTQRRNPISAAKLAAAIAADAEAAYAINSDGSTQDSTTWYEHDSSMKAISLAHPKTVFCLYGEGEGSGDVWHKFYFNGDMVFEDKIEVKLKEPDLDAIVPEMPSKPAMTRQDWLKAAAKGYTNMGFQEWLANQE